MPNILKMQTMQIFKRFNLFQVNVPFAHLHLLQAVSPSMEHACIDNVETITGMRPDRGVRI